MKRLNRPWAAVLIIGLTLAALLWGASALWRWSGYSYHYGMVGWGLSAFNWPIFLVMGLWHLLFWGLLTVGIVWLVQVTDRRAKPNPEEEG